MFNIKLDKDAVFEDISQGSNYITGGVTLNGHIDITDNKNFIIDNDVNVKIGDFEIKAQDLGRLLEKFAKDFMPQILV
jgi:hypothetical protein